MPHCNQSILLRRTAMKRISTALVAAAVATGLAITPAVAKDAPVMDENTTAPA